MFKPSWLSPITTTHSKSLQSWCSLCTCAGVFTFDFLKSLPCGRSVSYLFVLTGSSTFHPIKKKKKIYVIVYWLIWVHRHLYDVCKVNISTLTPIGSVAEFRNGCVIEGCADIDNLPGLCFCHWKIVGIMLSKREANKCKQKNYVNDYVGKQCDNMAKGQMSLQKLCVCVDWQWHSALHVPVHKANRPNHFRWEPQ